MDLAQPELTPNSVANIGKVKPAFSWSGWVPSFLNRHTLNDNSDAGKECKDCCNEKTAPNHPNMNLISHDAKKESSHGCFANANDHKTSHLAEELILDRSVIDFWIADSGVQLAQAVVCAYSDEDSVKEVQDLQHVSN